MLCRLLLEIVTPSVVVMLAMAAIARMPERLPSPFDKVDFLNWAWTWTRDTLHAFMNMRHPEPKP